MAEKYPGERKKFQKGSSYWRLKKAVFRCLEFLFSFEKKHKKDAPTRESFIKFVMVSDDKKREPLQKKEKAKIQSVLYGYIICEPKIKKKLIFIKNGGARLVFEAILELSPSFAELIEKHFPLLLNPSLTEHDFEHSSRNLQYWAISCKRVPSPTLKISSLHLDRTTLDDYCAMESSKFGLINP